VIVRLDTAELVDAGQDVGCCVAHAVGGRHLVRSSDHGALGAGAVVARDVEHEGIVEHAERLQLVQKQAGVVVGMLRERGIDFHQGCRGTLLVLG